MHALLSMILNQWKNKQFKLMCQQADLPVVVAVENYLGTFEIRQSL